LEICSLNRGDLTLLDNNIKVGSWLDEGERCNTSNDCPSDTIGSGEPVKTHDILNSDGSVWGGYYALSAPYTPSTCQCDAGGTYKTCGISWTWVSCVGNIYNKCGKKTINGDDWEVGPYVPENKSAKFVFKCLSTEIPCGNMGCN
jgi:hypothetical protein